MASVLYNRLFTKFIDDLNHFFAAKISAFCFETPSASTSLSLIFNDTKNLGLCFVPDFLN